MNHLTLIVILVVLGSMLLTIVSTLFSNRPRDKARITVEYAQKRGYALINPSLAGAWSGSRLDMLRNPTFRYPIDALSDIADIEGLKNASGGVLAFTCDLRSKQATIFNSSVTYWRVRGGQSYPYKVAKIKAAGLPRFSLAKVSVAHAVEEVVDKLVGAPQARIQVDARQYPEFSAHFWITGSDPNAIAAFLSSDKIRFLETAKLPGTLATNANYLVYFEEGALLSEKDFDAFIASVETLVTNIL